MNCKTVRSGTQQKARICQIINTKLWNLDDLLVKLDELRLYQNAKQQTQQMLRYQTK